MKKELFTEDQEKDLKILLAKAMTGRGAVVEDISTEIHNKMFPLTKEQTAKIDEKVENFIYGGGVQDQLDFKDRLDMGLDYIKQAILFSQI